MKKSIDYVLRYRIVPKSPIDLVLSRNRKLPAKFHQKALKAAEHNAYNESQSACNIQNLDRLLSIWIVNSVTIFKSYYSISANCKCLMRY